MTVVGVTEFSFYILGTCKCVSLNLSKPNHEHYVKENYYDSLSTAVNNKWTTKRGKF